VTQSRNIIAMSIIEASEAESLLLLLLVLFFFMADSIFWLCGTTGQPSLEKGVHLSRGLSSFSLTIFD
jgi:hypothetical protein